MYDKSPEMKRLNPQHPGLQKSKYKPSFPLETLGTSCPFGNPSILSKFLILDFMSNFTISGIFAPLLPETRRRCYCLLATLYFARETFFMIAFHSFPIMLMPGDWLDFLNNFTISGICAPLLPGTAAATAATACYLLCTVLWRHFSWSRSILC